jgi:hypothetical protein
LRNGSHDICTTASGKEQQHGPPTWLIWDELLHRQKNGTYITARFELDTLSCEEVEAASVNERTNE